MSDVRDVPHAAVRGIDPAVVTAWIRRLGIGAQPPLTFRRIGAGKSNITLLVEDRTGRRWILRRPPLGHLLASAHDVAREHRILLGLAGTDVPAPRVVALCEDEAVSPVPLLLMEFVDAVVLEDDASLAAHDEPWRHRVSLSVAAALAAIHAVDLHATGLDSLASHAPYAARQLKRWRRQWEDSKTRELPSVEALADRLEHAIPPQHEVSLVHGDCHLLNVMTDAETGAVRAVVDWELSTLGEPLADLGTLLSYWPQADDMPPVGNILLSTNPGFATRRELVAAYARASGRDVSALPFWLALAYWKTAIVAEGVRRRTLDEPGNGTPMPARTVEGLIDRAIETADEAGL